MAKYADVLDNASRVAGGPDYLRCEVCGSNSKYIYRLPNGALHCAAHAEDHGPRPRSESPWWARLLPRINS